MSDIVFKNKNLKALIRAFGTDMPSGRIGVLGGGGSRTSKNNSKVSNAQIGAWHEFGTAHLPIRSWLRVPLIDRLEKALVGARAFDKLAIKQIIAEKSLLTFMQKVMAMAEAIVLAGFDSGGYGMWKPSNMNRKKNWQTLVETQQLRNSITSEVVD